MKTIFLLMALAVSDAPETWFHIIGGNASKEGMSADIAAIADAGISGIQLFHGQIGAVMTWPGVTNEIPCMSSQWLDLIKHAESECHRHGLTFKMQNCPGWSMSGGPWITPDKAMRKLVAFEPNAKPKFDADDDYREIGAVTFDLEDSDAISVVAPNPQQIAHEWAYEPDSRLVATKDGKEVFRCEYPAGAWQDYATLTFRIPHGRAYGTNLQFHIESSHYANKPVEAKVLTEPRLDQWETKASWGLRELTMSKNRYPVMIKGKRTLVFGHVNAKRTNGPAPKEATGWECDKMDARGFEANFAGYLDKVLKAGVKIDGTLVDSWECSVQTWTWKMEAEFKRIAGYELRPWLPALFGYVLKSEAETERFLLDWRNVCSRLIEENYFGTIARLAREHGMHSQYETAFGDVLPGDIMRYWKFADEPMCEFWNPHVEGEGFVGSYNFKPILPCASAAHIYGKRRVSAESLTSFKLTFNENFNEWKRNIDKHFCRGVTHVVFHTYTHNPVVNGLPPSSSMGCAIGSPFQRRQPWWPYMKQFTAYLTRCGHELERGLPVVDILMYIGDAVGHKPREDRLHFGNRYKYDYLNHDVLMTALKAKDGRLVIDSYPANASQTKKMSYRVLWIPSGTYVSQESADRIAALEKAGARVVRGDFTPDWPSPLATIGLDAKDLIGWYQRHDAGGEVFFIVKKNGDSGFVTGQEGNWSWYDPVRNVRKSLATARAEAQAKWRSLPVQFKPIASYPRWATERVYEGVIDLPENLAAKTVRLDLGEVHDWARVLVDGREVAKLWCAPYAVELDASMLRRKAVIRVEVTSTIYNALVHDASLPPEQRTTWTINGPDKNQRFAPAGLSGRPAKLYYR